MTNESVKSPLRQLADVMSEHRSLLDMEAEYEDSSSEYDSLDRELATKALTLIDLNGLTDLSNPLVAEAHRFVSKYRQEQAQLRASYPTDKAVEADAYKNGALYRNLSGRSQELVDQLMIDLLGDGVLDTVGTVVRSTKEAADALGLPESDVERAYGLLSDIEDELDEGDTVEFMALSFEQAETIPGITDDSEGDGASLPGGGNYELSDRYVARVRKNEDAQVVSLVMDAVPPAENNAVYVLRNDDGRLADVTAAIATKKDARANGARRVFHTDSGEAGTLKRINTLLRIPLEMFRDSSYRPR